VKSLFWQISFVGDSTMGKLDMALVDNRYIRKMNGTVLSRAKNVDLLIAAKKLRAEVVKGDPANASMAALELGARVDFVDSRPVSRVILAADFLSLVSVELIHGIAAVVHNGEALFSIFPLIRSVIEHSTTIIWVLDPDCTTVERAARAALLMERSQSELTKAAKRMSAKDADEIYVAAKANLTKLRADIDGEFVCSIANMGVVAGQSFPRPTEIVEHFGNRWGDGRQWMGTYDYLCGTATHPSFNITEFLTTDEERIKTGLPYQLSISDDFLNRLLRAGLVPFVKSIEHFSVYAGWNHGPIDEYMDKMNEVLGPTMH
jgi:hypothetical protein